MPRRASATSWLTRALAPVLAATALGVSVVTASPAAADATRSPLTSGEGPTDAAALAGASARAEAAYDRGRRAVEALGAQHARLEEAAEAAEATAAELHLAVRDQAEGTLSGALDSLWGDSLVDRALEASEDAAAARALAQASADAVAEGIRDVERLRAAYDEALAAEERAQAGWDARQAARAAAARAALPVGYDVDDRAQDARNRAALRRWREHLFAVADAAVVPPAAGSLADPARLPAGLEVARDRTGVAVSGVASAERPDGVPVTVLSAETVSAVSSAFARLGLPEAPGISPTEYACGGFVTDTWSETLGVPAEAVAQWRELPRVPLASLQLGDLVLLGNRTDGVSGSGIYVGDRELILADPVTGSAGVQPLPRRVLGVRRVTLPAGRPAAGDVADACTEPTPTTTSGATTTPVTTGSFASGPATLALPVPAGSYRVTAGFADAGALWSADHTGQDFAAPVGTDVYAMADGVVTVESPSWAGTLVRIDHGGGVETWYAHLSSSDVVTGDVVSAGERIASVGDEGNSTGPHLHFEVRLDGLPVDPSQVVEIPELPRAEHPNGEMPLDQLCAATADGVQQLRCDAAVSYRLLAAAYLADTGSELCITDSYRSRSAQEQLFVVKPSLAAKPGTSVHGLGRAVDLCDGVERFGTPEHEWVAANGPRFGWVHPDWAAATGSRPEPWHFEYAG